MLHEQLKIMNKMIEFFKIQEYFQQLNFDIELRQSNKKELILIDKEEVCVIIKGEVRPSYLSNINHLQENKKLILIIGDYITPKAKEKLRQNNINYIDSFGNAYFNLRKLKIHIEHNNARPIYGKNTNKAFTKSGAQVIFRLLEDENTIHLSHRNLAAKSNVSLGTISNVINSLFDLGFLVKWKNKNEYQLVRKVQLLEKWIELYNEKILPAFFVGKYRMTSANEFNWKNISSDKQALWSGEPGAAILTKYLNPEKFTLYTTKSKIDTMKDYHLLPDKHGNIKVYKPFWGMDENYSLLQKEISDSIVHPLLIYAELIYSDNSRNIETAQLIYNEYIKSNL